MQGQAQNHELWPLGVARAGGHGPDDEGLGVVHPQHQDGHRRAQGAGPVGRTVGGCVFVLGRVLVGAWRVTVSFAFVFILHMRAHAQGQASKGKQGQRGHAPGEGEHVGRLPIIAIQGAGAGQFQAQREKRLRQQPPFSLSLELTRTMSFSVRIIAYFGPKEERFGVGSPAQRYAHNRVPRKTSDVNLTLSFHKTYLYGPRLFSCCASKNSRTFVTHPNAPYRTGVTFRSDQNSKYTSRAVVHVPQISEIFVTPKSSFCISNICTCFQALKFWPLRKATPVR